MFDAYFQMLVNYAFFRGRTDAAGYWWAVLCNFLISLVLGLMIRMIPILRFVSVLYTLAMAIPLLACAVRRLHDTGRSGWYLLLGLVPVVGTILVIVLLAQASESGENKYGSNVDTY